MAKMSKALVAAATVSALATGGANAQQVFSTDVIVLGSLCVGFDCVSSENFGFDTIRLKENNLRIHFDDTSSSGSFPSNDWRLVANDTNNGGASYFAIEDATAGNRPFTVTAGAGANAIFVSSSGNVGIGEGAPVVELHVQDGDSPTLRLEQDGSSGFTAQTWDLAGNEANFFIRDATNGSKLPFKIKPGAPTNSLFVAANGDIGMGSDSPADALHIRRTSGSVGLRLDTGSQPNPVRLNFNANNNEFRITFDGLGINQMRLDSSGNMRLPGTITTAGSCSAGCDKVFDPDYDLPTMDEQALAMWKSGHLPNVGPTAEDGPFNLTEKVGGILNELEKAHIYISQLNSNNKAMAAHIKELDDKLNRLGANQKAAATVK